jgi:hypothetical protein
MKLKIKANVQKVGAGFHPRHPGFPPEENESDHMMGECTLDGETYEKVKTLKAYRKMIKAMGWNSVKEFEIKTGTDFQMLKNRWFTLVQDRVFFADEDQAKNMEVLDENEWS